MLEPRSVIEGVAWPAVANNAGSAMLATLFQLEQSQWLDAAQLWARQRIQLRALLQHTRTFVPFYADNLAAEIAQLPEEFSPADFARLPLLRRADIQRNFQALCATRLPTGHGPVSAGSTSGSTGEPVRFLGTLISNFFWHAFTLREHLWHRREFGADMMALRAEPEASVDANWFGETGAAIFSTGRCVVLPVRWTYDRQLARILEEKPAYLLGYPSNLLELFLLADSGGVQMPWLREVRSFGEAVSPALRSHLREKWKVPLTDLYSARETGYIALQCPDHEVYHVQSEGAFVEVIDEQGKPCVPGQTGEIVVTPLHNFGMPLIRYSPGDYAEVGERCACGRGLPVINKIKGRVRNSLKLPDGTRRWPTVGTTTLLDVAPVRRFKVVQKTLHEIEVRLVVARPLSDSELSALRAHLTNQLDHPFNFTFVFLDEFPPVVGDKFEDFVSEVA